MNAKRFLSGFLALMLLLPLSACSSDTPAADTTAAAEADSADTTEAETVATDEFGREIVEDGVPADLKYDGDVVRIFTRDDNKYWLLEITAEEGTGEILNDSVYNRNMTVEERLGIQFEYLKKPGTFAVRNEWFNVLRAAVQADDDSIDSASVYISQGAPLITEGLFYNLLDVEMLAFEKPWWNQSFNEEMTMYDQLYASVGDLMLSMTSMTVVNYFNKNLLAELYPNENLYDMVFDGKWTLDYMTGLVSGTYNDLNGDGARDDGDRYGYRVQRSTVPGDSWPIALGIYATTKNAQGIPELSFYNEKAVTAFEKLQKLYTDAGSSEGKPNFINGSVLFYSQQLTYTDSLRDMEDEYGILPLPKFDEAQKEYATIPQNGHSMITITKTANDPQMVGAALELLAAESYRQVTPMYFEVTMKSKYLRASEDAQMFDLIMDSVKFNFGYVWAATRIGNIAQLMRDPAIDLASTYAANADSYQAKLTDLLAKLESLNKAQ